MRKARGDAAQHAGLIGAAGAAAAEHQAERIIGIVAKQAARHHAAA